MRRDKSWDSHDALIQKYVAEANKWFARTVRYSPLDWQIVKAMVWTEVMAGPSSDAWNTRPMQIGNAGDDGWETLTETDNRDKNQIAKTRLVAPSDLKTQMTHFGRSDPATNLRAGIYWLCYKAAAFRYVQVDDSQQDRTYSLMKGESPAKIAPKLRTTPPVIMQDSKLTQRQVSRLRPGQNLHYHNAHMEWQISSWSPWELAVNAYNGLGAGAGDSGYMDKFRANLKEIKGSAISSSAGVGSK